jgi:hypothetical protein
MKHRPGSLLRLIANTEGQIFCGRSRGKLARDGKDQKGARKISSQRVQSQGWAKRFFLMTSLSLVAMGAIMFSEFL